LTKIKVPALPSNTVLEPVRRVQRSMAAARHFWPAPILLLRHMSLRS
jgi:hypothetical protein